MLIIEMMSDIILGEIIMEKVYKDKLIEIVELLNDPDETVLIKEVKEKLENLLAIVNNPEKIEIEKQENNKKLEQVIELVHNAMANPDIELEYCIPEVATTSETCDVSGDPYILVTYVVSEYTKPTRKIRLTDTYLNNTPEEIANLVTFSIEQFKTEIDSVEMG